MNAAVQIRIAAVPVLPPAVSRLSPLKQSVYAALAQADGHFVTCADLVVRIDGTFDPRRKRDLMRAVSKLRAALRGVTDRTIVTAGSAADLRYALIAVERPVGAADRGRGDVAPDLTRKARITEALVAAGGRYLDVADLCRAAEIGVDPAGLAGIRGHVNEIRSALRRQGIAAAILSRGYGEALAYAWSDTIAAAPVAVPEADGDAPRPTLRITLPPIGCTHCIFDGDSLVQDGVKRPRARTA